MRCVITGAQGFIGRYLTAAILKQCKSTRVLGIGRSERLDGQFSYTIQGAGQAGPAPLPSGLLECLDKRWQYERVSLFDSAGLQTILREFKPEYVFHLASCLKGDSQRDLLETNVAGTGSLMEALGKSNIKATVVLGSSGGVYGGLSNDQLPATEGMPCEPVDVYSASKLAAEHLARIVGITYGTSVVTARIFNVVGPGQDERHLCGRLASKLVQLADRSDPVLRIGDLSTTRDFVDVRDVAAALLHLASGGNAFTTYNVGTGVETPTIRVLEALARLGGLSDRIRVESVPATERGVPRHYANIRRLRDTGFTLRYRLEESLSDLLSYYQTLIKRA